MNIKLFTQADISDEYLHMLNSGENNYSRHSSKKWNTESCVRYLEELKLSGSTMLGFYENGSLIGTTCAVPVNDYTINLGIMLSPNARGKGLGFKIWSMAIKYFRSTGIKTVMAGTHIENTRMLKILRRTMNFTSYQLVQGKLTCQFKANFDY